MNHSNDTALINASKNIKFQIWQPKNLTVLILRFLSSVILRGEELIWNPPLFHIQILVQ